MTEFGQQITFEQLLDRHGWIQVPMIQRDYAQGRESEAEVRKEFLDALHGALSLPTDAPALPLNLDFIYGSVEGDGDTRFLPLDGQQRLTTLFLIHWYLAWRDGCWEEFMESMCPSGNSRFRYAVRPSSTEFFDCLVKFQPEGSPDSHRSLSPMLKDQSWYFRHWRLDPTIQSSLEMLDAIHERFRKSSGLYERITDSDRPAITFQLMDLENFGLSDDLYIKMNARGKPLTAFETFKARYEQELESQFEEETRLIGNESFSVAEFFSRRMDTTWADFFWVYRNKETNLFDEAVMNLFRTVALLSRDPENESYLNDVFSLRSRFVKSSYPTFYNKGWLDRSFSKLLILLLELWTEGETGFTPQLPDTRFFDEALLFEKAMNEPTELTFTEIVQFYGYVVYARQNSESLDPDAFQEWMRVVFNLSVNTTYDRPSDMQRSISALLKIVPNSGNILQFLAASDVPITGFNSQQVSEEKLKAELILADGGWRRLIDQAEGHGYFRGQIEFLLDFCGVLGKRNNTDGVNWKDSVHSTLQEQFEKYLRKAKLMFTDRGLANQGQFRWERALLSIGDYLLPSGRQNISFLTNSSTDQASWKRLLRGTPRYVQEARSLLQELLDRLNADASLGGQLDKVISEATGLEPWRQAFIETPKAFAYCEKRVIRRNSEREIYLLKKTQLNGAHAELFTYCLFHNKLLPMTSSDDGFHPLELSKHYDSVNGTEDEPGFRFTWSQEEHLLTFNVEWNGCSFIIRIPIRSLQDLPDVYETLRDEAGFAEKETNLVRETSPTDFLNILLELRKALPSTAT